MFERISDTEFTRVKKKYIAGVDYNVYQNQLKNVNSRVLTDMSEKSKPYEILFTFLPDHNSGGNCEPNELGNILKSLPREAFPCMLARR